jgi:F-type H+-transporting ATPase subunit gamma
MAQPHIKAESALHALELEVSGKRGLAYFRVQRIAVDRSYLQFEDKPSYDEVEQLADRYIEAFLSGRIDRLDVVYTRFQSASRQIPEVATLLPMGEIDGVTKDRPAKETPATAGPPVDFEFLPSPKDILDEIVPASFKARLFKCFLDAAVSEQISRMVAMKGATENAGTLIKSLTMKYNRARQSQITSELAEIIGTAEALK